MESPNDVSYNEEQEIENYDETNVKLNTKSCMNDIEDNLIVSCEYVKDLAQLRNMSKNLDDLSLFSLRGKYDNVSNLMNSLSNSIQGAYDASVLLLDIGQKLSGNEDPSLVLSVKHVRTIWNTFTYDGVLSRCNTNICIMNTLKNAIENCVDGKEDDEDLKKKVAIANYEYARDSNRLYMHMNTILEGSLRLKENLQDLIDEKESKSSDEEYEETDRDESSQPAPKRQRSEPIDLSVDESEE